MSKGQLCLLLFVAMLLMAILPQGVKGAPNQVNRTFYLTSSPVTSTTPGTLSPTTPTGACPSCTTNVTRTSVAFTIPTPLGTELTIQTPLIMSLWIDYRFNSTIHPLLEGSFSYHAPGIPNWTNSNSSQLIPFGLNNITFDVPVTPTQLADASSIAIEVSVESVPKNSTISLLWGSMSTPSKVVIPMSGYETLVPQTSVTIEDTNRNPGPFYLNSPYNLLEVKVQVQSALGLGDILKVNMTLFDPQSLPVKGATNETMQGPTTGQCPCTYIGSWQYQSSSAQGQYSALVNIVDIQGNVAYASSPSASTFLLVPPGYVPFPYNLLPYIIIGAVAVSGAAAWGVFYRRGKRKSYLVPFDHFNNLTGGGLTGGTVVTVEGNTGSGKTLLIEQLMGEDLRNARPCVFVSTSDFPNNIRSNMKTMGVDVSRYEQNGLLTFVDGYSAEAGQESHEKVFVPSLGDLTTLGIKITSALPSPSFKGGSLYFDSLTPLASKARPESIVSFVQSVGAKVKGLSGKAFFTVGLGLDGVVQRQLEDTADCIVQMEAFEEGGSRKRRLKIAKLRGRKHQEGWTLFTIEEGKGIIFYSKRPKQ